MGNTKEDFWPGLQWLVEEPDRLQLFLEKCYYVLYPERRPDTFCEIFGKTEEAE